MTTEKYISNQRVAFNKDLKTFFDAYKTSNVLMKAIWYSLSNGGKRIRPVLVREVSRSLGLKKSYYLNLMLAVELIHSYSLVHDDLPSMDNDDYRRGKLSTHKKFDEAQAILAGNGMLTLAFEILSKKYNAHLCQIIAEIAGAYGLAGGQSVDIENDTKKISLDKVLHIHELKTARLFEFCISAPFYSLNMVKEARLAKKYGNFVGRTFQIVDDIIDADQDQDNKNILNYITKKDALDLCHTYKTQADRCLDKIFPTNKNKLSEIFNYIISQANRA